MVTASPGSFRELVGGSAAGEQNLQILETYLTNIGWIGLNIAATRGLPALTCRLIAARAAVTRPSFAGFCHQIAIFDAEHAGGEGGSVARNRRRSFMHNRIHCAPDSIRTVFRTGRDRVESMMLDRFHDSRGPNGPANARTFVDYGQVRFNVAGQPRTGARIFSLNGWKCLQNCLNIL